MNVFIFTLNSCEHCSSLKNKLDDNHISYEELEINTHKDMWDKIVTNTGYNFLPTIFIMNDNEIGSLYIPVRDYQTQDEIIDIIRKKI